jgi:molybdopterin converting factor small subunit
MNNKRIAEEDVIDLTKTKKQQLSEDYDEEEESDDEFDMEEYIGFLEDISFDSLADTLGEMSPEEAKGVLAKEWTMENLREIIKECVLSCYTSGSTSKDMQPPKVDTKQGKIYADLHDAVLEVMQLADEPEGEVDFEEMALMREALVDALTEKLFKMKDDVESALDSVRDEINFVNANDDELEQ